MTPKNLSEVLSAVLNEFNKANVASDLLSAQWDKIYNEHSRLNGFTPGKVRIVTANITLPVAIADLGKAQVRDEGVNQKDIYSALDTKLAPAERKRIAGLILEELHQGNGSRLADKNLPGKLTALAAKFKKEHPGIRQILDARKIRAAQKEFAKNPVKETDCKCYYKTDDLEKFSSDNIVKFNFAINVSL